MEVEAEVDRLNKINMDEVIFNDEVTRLCQICVEEEEWGEKCQYNKIVNCLINNRRKNRKRRDIPAQIPLYIYPIWDIPYLYCSLSLLDTWIDQLPLPLNYTLFCTVLFFCWIIFFILEAYVIIILFMTWLSIKHFKKYCKM